MKLLYCVCFNILALSLYAQCYPDRHSTNWFDGWVSCQMQENPNKSLGNSHWIQYDLGALYRIDAVKIWNTNDPANLNFGSKVLQVDYSEDSVTWKNAGDILLDKADGTNRYEGADWIPTDIPKARYLLFTVKENHGGKCAGFAEIRFSAEKIKINTSQPNPSAASSLVVHAEPNPFHKECRIAVRCNEPGDLEYKIADMYGRTIAQGNAKIHRHFYYLDLDASLWKSGVYVLTCTKANQQAQLNLVKL